MEPVCWSSLLLLVSDLAHTASAAPLQSTDTKLIHITCTRFHGPLSRTTRVSRYQKGKTNLDLLKQETVNGSGISWAICKSAPRSRQITMPAPQHSVFYRLDAFPATQPTASKHWMQKLIHITSNFSGGMSYSVFYPQKIQLLLASPPRSTSRTLDYFKAQDLQEISSSDECLLIPNIIVLSYSTCWTTIKTV